MVFLALGVLGIAQLLNTQRHRHSDESSLGVGLGLVAFALAIVIGLIANWFSQRSEFRRKANILYAVTDRRAIFWSPEPKGSAIRIKTVRRGQIKDVERVQRRTARATSSSRLARPTFA